MLSSQNETFHSGYETDYNPYESRIRTQTHRLVTRGISIMNGKVREGSGKVIVLKEAERIRPP